MGKPGTLHKLVAGGLLLAVTLIVCLALVRYKEDLERRRLAVYDLVGEALAFSAVTESGRDAEEWLAARGEQAAGFQRYFHLKAGVYYEELDMEEPPVFIQDTEGRKEVTGRDMRIGELVSLLGQRLAAPAEAEGEGKAEAAPAGAGFETRELWWGYQDDQGRDVLVAAYPVFQDGEFEGVVGVEKVADSRRELLVPLALWILLGFLAVFAVATRFLPERTVLSFTLAGVLAVLIGLGAFTSLQSDLAREVTGARGLRTANLLATVGTPDGVRGVGRLWADVWKESAPGLAPAQSAAAPFDAWNSEVLESQSGAVRVVQSGPGILARALDGVIPSGVVLLMFLVLGAAGIRTLSRFIKALVDMPGVYAYIAPTMVCMLVLVMVPFVMGVLLGFFNADYEFIGLQNFGEILFPADVSDTNFYFTLGVTVLWTFSNVVLHVSIGLALALVLNNPAVKGRGLFRVLLIVPWAVPNYITALIWKWMFNYEFGAINLILQSLGLDKVAWFGTSFWTNFFANLATNTWLGFPFMMVVSLGALQSIPTELYEAADIDGASRWQKFRNITLPLLKPALFPAIILGTIWTFNMFNVIYLVSGGGPDNRTNILITEAYRFFKVLNRYGFAAAYCVMIFVILLMYTIITNRITKATEGAFE